MWSSLSPSPSPRSPSTTKRSPMTSSSAPPPKPCSPLPATPTVWVWKPAFSPCFIPGVRVCTFIRTCTVSFRAAACHPTTSAGSPAAGVFSFQWKDYRDGQKQKVMTLSAEEFIRRFLQHALPPGFQRIRYYGFLANCHRAAKLDLCRRLLATACSLLLPQPADCRDFWVAVTSTNLRLCPQCGVGILIRMQVFPSCHGPVPLR